eukprot:1600515-Amphidinium_carterae.1
MLRPGLKGVCPRTMFRTDLELEGDREIVLAAVKQNWRALEFAAESCRGDREIVLAAVQKAPRGWEPLVLKWASDELIEESSFANEVKTRCHVLKISMISGRQAMVVSPRRDNLNTEEVLEECCSKLGIGTTGSMCLVSGDGVVVPAGAFLSAWPGIRACGEISEYQLVVQQS